MEEKTSEELRGFLKKRKLSTLGSKPELLQRAEDAYGDVDVPVEDASTSKVDAAPQQRPDDVSELQTEQLTREESTSGNKAAPHVPAKEADGDVIASDGVTAAPPVRAKEADDDVNAFGGIKASGEAPSTSKHGAAPAAAPAAPPAAPPRPPDNTGRKMSLKVIPESLSKLFYEHGKAVARRPLPYLLTPIILTFVLLIGLIRIEQNSDAEYLYVPTTAPSLDDRDFIEDSFPNDHDVHFTRLRVTSLDYLLQIHIQPKDGHSMWNDPALASVHSLNNFVQNFAIEWNGNLYNYSQLCANWQGQCAVNNAIELVGSSLVPNLEITFPVHRSPTVPTMLYNLVSDFGDVTTNATASGDVIIDVGAVLLSYFVRYQDDDDIEKANIWLDRMRDHLENFEDATTEVTYWNGRTLDQELERSITGIVPLFSIAYSSLWIFSTLALMMSDWVRSKPWLASAGMSAAALGIGSSIGFLAGCGLSFASVAGTMPFLIIGIGIDDMFVMISAWRHTSVHLNVEERMGLSMKDAAVSITITSATDALAFGIGSIAPFRSVQIFCAYTGLAVIFTYAYMITFTVACFVYCGQREAANKHPFTRKVVRPIAQSEGYYKIWCAGGNAVDADVDETGTARKADPAVASAAKSPGIGSPAVRNQNTAAATATPEDDGIVLPWRNRFFGTTFADFLLLPVVRVNVAAFYLLMICVAGYGVSVLDQGLSRVNLVPDDSYYQDFQNRFSADFYEVYGLFVQVAIDEPLDYTDASVRAQIDDLKASFRASRYFHEGSGSWISWLDLYLNFLTGIGQDVDAMDMPTFISVFQTLFLTQPGFEHNEIDVIIENNQIIRSRFFALSANQSDSNAEQKMMLRARDLADDSELKVKVFASAFPFFDQFVVILPQTLQNLLIAVASMAVVSLLLIPSLSTVVWVTLATVSIVTCVIGYMALWDVSLDSISMINLVMCIGFSVDFAAHISYHYAATRHTDPRQRTRSALGHLGTPILLSALSTIIAVAALSTANNYIFRTFFKIVFLVMVFGFLHAMFVLPVALATLNTRTLRQCVSMSAPSSKAGQAARKSLAKNT